MKIPTPPQPSKRAMNSNVVRLPVRYPENTSTNDAYDSFKAASTARGEVNIVTAQESFRRFASAGEVALWDIQKLVAPAYEKLTADLNQLDELDIDALMSMGKKEDARVILLLHALAEIDMHELPELGDLLMEGVSQVI